MNIDFGDLKNYLENKEENIFVKAFVFSVIISVLLILVVVFSSYKKKDSFYENVLYIENNEVILTAYLDELELITNNHKMIINNKSFNYNIKEIGILNESDRLYQIKILINMNYSQYNNLFLKYKILLKEESILRYIVRVVKGE